MRVLLARWRWRGARLPTILAERDLLVELRGLTRADSRVITRRRIAGGAACSADGAGTNSAKESERHDGPKH
jgi:hypothetical protein